MICDSSYEERPMVQLSLSASDMAPIASKDTVSFMPYGTVSRCGPSPSRFEDEVGPPGRPSVTYIMLMLQGPTILW